VGRIERVILGFWAFEQVELDEARHFVQMAVARQPDMLECRFGGPNGAASIPGL
jgi:hypothetical protein